jgi:HAD superfamily hydrolase (TIGR01509 family)
LKNTSAIIFDLGGVIMDIEVRRTLNAFTALGIENIHQYFGHGFAASFFSDHEAGRISDEAFIAKIKTLLPEDVGEEAVVEAWNALLLSFPAERIALLKELRLKYRVFLFSNTNAIHYNKFSEIYSNAFPGKLEDLFEKAYFSHQLGHRKPDPKGYLKIVAENVLDREKTLFVDDALMNVKPD